jgi:4-hydroxybenzoate polyprenyltransferase
MRRALAFVPVALRHPDGHLLRDEDGTVTHPAAAARTPTVLPLLRAAHLGPTLAVATIAALLAIALDLAWPVAAVVTLAVLAGQLTIGWANDLLDAERDRSVGRTDKPLVSGELTEQYVQRSLTGAAVACVVLSLLAGWRSGLTHLALLVASGHVYNLRLKATPWSWLPYAVAFGSLPAVVSLAGSPPAWPPWWMIVAASTLGVGAHVLNALPDLADDAATGVGGLPHRLGAGPSRILATALLVAASVVAVLGPAGAPAAAGVAALVVVAVLAAVALLGRGKVPFTAAVAIALVNVVVLVAVAP